MALIKCPECEHQVSDKAESCPNCGVTIANQEDETKETPAEGSFGESVALFTMIIVFSALIALALWGALHYFGSGSSESKNRPEHDSSTAFLMCKKFVEERLRSPSTADFPWGASRYSKHRGEGRYQVTAYVDSQNAFGATIRTNFTCTVKHAGGNNWRLEGLEMEP